MLDQLSDTCFFSDRRRSDGVVLIAQEERAADVVSTGLLDGAEEQKL